MFRRYILLLLYHVTNCVHEILVHVFYSNVQFKISDCWLLILYVLILYVNASLSYVLNFLFVLTNITESRFCLGYLFSYFRFIDKLFLRLDSKIKTC